VEKKRLDILMVEKALVPSRSLAQRMIMAGEVRVNGELVLKPSQQFKDSDVIKVQAKPKYVSRGGEKLEAALMAFDIDVRGKIAADVGSSTGGFSDCLLQSGVEKVYALDVGKGILDWKLRKDKRVIVFENQNVRYLAKLPQPVQIVTIDVSFISLRLILPVVKNWFINHESSQNQAGDVIALIKPQFEAGREEVSRGKGVIKDPQIHLRVLKDILEFAESTGYHVNNLILSPIAGQKGNIEFLSHLSLSEEVHFDFRSRAEELLKR
jgi:23S rRNA (cytidine1920-2'-O)/16S rRNA (cytidine1409-2'-O)-methyltransferase